MEDDRAKYLFLSLLQARVGSSLVAHLGNLAPEAVLQMPVAEIAGRAKITERASHAFEELQRVFDPGRMQDRLAEKGIVALTPVDEAYPGPLRSIPDPPPAVFVNGDVPDTVSVALVGSRKASVTGIETARALGLALSERGVCVVSGLALGVDAAAHEGAVEAGGPTVGVLGCGIDVTYPTKYKRLRATLSRPAQRRLRATCRSKESLARGPKFPRSPHGKSPNCSRRRSVRRSDHCASRREVVFTEVPRVRFLRSWPRKLSQLVYLGDAVPTVGLVGWSLLSNGEGLIALP